MSVPRHHRKAEKAGDQSASAEADETRREVGEVVRRTDDVRADVDVERCDEQRDEAEEGEQWLMESAEELNRTPDRLAEDDSRRGGYGDAEEGVEHHGDRQTEGLTDDLRILILRDSA